MNKEKTYLESMYAEEIKNGEIRLIKITQSTGHEDGSLVFMTVVVRENACAVEQWINGIHAGNINFVEEFRQSFDHIVKKFELMAERFCSECGWETNGKSHECSKENQDIPTIEV